jgi:mitochondrial import inner membrane translocase subunit TIM10
MSFFGMKKPTSAEKIAAAETEAKMMIDMHNRYVLLAQSLDLRDFSVFDFVREYLVQKYEVRSCAQLPHDLCRVPIRRNSSQPENKYTNSLSPSMGKVCQAKCIPNDYREGELNKGESVCLDRCVAKFFETHQKIAEMMQDQQAQQQARGGAGGFGFGG